MVQRRREQQLLMVHQTINHQIILVVSSKNVNVVCSESDLQIESKTDDTSAKRIVFEKKAKLFENKTHCKNS